MSKKKEDFKYYKYKGERLTLNGWGRKLGINNCTLYHRMKRGWSFEDALLTQIRKSQRRTVDLFIPQPEKIITETNEKTIFITKEICSVFGCSKELSRQEKLFGNKCINHQKCLKTQYY